MPTVTQPTFAGGEIAPSLYGRVDLARYQTGLRHCENFVVLRQGGAANRAGLQFLGEVRDSSQSVRLIPFQFSPTQSYILEFGDNYIRVWRDGGLVLKTSATAWSNVTNYSTGAYVSYLGVIYRAIVTNVGFQPNLSPAQWLDTTSDQTYVIATTYVAGELLDLQYTQSADVLTLAHQNHAPAELRRLADDNWTLGNIAFVPDIAQVTGVGAVGFNAPTNYSGVTAYARGEYIDNLGDVYRSLQDANTGHLPPDRVWWDGTTDNGTRRAFQYVVTAVNAAGQEGLPSTPVDITAVLNSDHPITVRWSVVPNAVSYNVYRGQNGVYGYIGNATTLIFEDIEYTPLYLDTPPNWTNPFPSSGKWPGCVEYFQQRLMFARTTERPETIWGSASGDYHNFGAATPPKDDDALEFTMLGRQVNEVQHLVPLDQLLVLSNGNEWRVTGGEDGVLTPSNVVSRAQSAYGASRLKPLLLGSSVLYVQEKGNIVRDLRFSFADDGFVGDDLTIMAAHLFEGHTIVDWAYSQVPYSIVWAVRDDGVLLGFTYMREQEVWAWHQHTTEGAVERVAVISEGEEDVVYAVVRRVSLSPSPTLKRYVERLHSRTAPDGYVADYFFVDAGLTYDGYALQTLPLRITNTSDVAIGDTVTLSGTGVFTGKVPGDILTLRNGGDRLRLTLVTVPTANSATATCNKVVPGTPDTPSTTEWVYGDGVTVMSGLDHLEGYAVAVLADGSAVGPLLVAGGSITLPAPAIVVHAGLPYVADLETLDLAPAGEAVRDKQKIIPRVNLVVQETRGLYVGEDRQHMNEFKQRSDEPYDDPMPPYTGLVEVRTDATWNKRGRLVVQQRDPLPITVLSLMPDVQVGGN